MKSEIVIAAHQPNFMPNLSFFYKMKLADKFILISNLQFERQEGWQRRNLFRTRSGEVWLTVPVLGSQEQLIKKVKVKYEKDWRRKHLRTLSMNYGKHGGEILEKLNDIYDEKFERLFDLNVKVIELIKELLGVETPLIIDEEVSGEKHELMINICRKHGGNVYLSGGGARNYMDDSRIKELEKNGIKHRFVGEEPAPARDFRFSALYYLLMIGREETLSLLQNKLAPEVTLK